MDLFSVITALIVAAIALLLILGFFKLLYSAARPMLQGSLERMQFSKQQALLKAAEQAGAKPENLKKLEQAIIIYSAKNDFSTLRKAHSHNLSVLAVLVSIAERQGVRLSQLPIIEDLLSSRLETLKLIGELSKRPASWSDADFERQKREAFEQLNTNERSLRATLGALFIAISKSPNPDSVTYH